MSLADCIIARSRQAAAIVAESKSRIEEEEKRIAAVADDLGSLAYDTFISYPLKKAGIDPATADFRAQNKRGHGLLYDRASKQIRAIAKDPKAAAYVSEALKHAWDDKAGFVAAATCFVTVEEARTLGYKW
jgi:hypothetical protein